MYQNQCNFTRPVFKINPFEYRDALFEFRKHLDGVYDHYSHISSCVLFFSFVLEELSWVQSELKNVGSQIEFLESSHHPFLG